MTNENATSRKLFTFTHMKWLLFSLGCAAATLGHTQDFVVLNTRDTLRGKVKLMSYDLLDRVHLQGERKQTFTAREVRMVQLEGITYRPVRLGNGVRFMQELRSGYLSFYAYREPTSNRYDGRLLQLASGNQIDLPNIGFKKQVSEFLRECPALADSIREGKKGRNELDLIITEFNACMDAKTANRTAGAIPAAAPVAANVTRLQQELSEADFPNKKDAEDMLSDIIKRTSNNEKLPNYLVEGLTNLLRTQPELLEQWNNIKDALRKGN